MVNIPKLIPCQQWICDTCKEVIREAEEGYIEFKGDSTRRIIQTTIVHHRSFSPYHPSKKGCYRFEGPGDKHLDLKSFLGPEGISRLLAFLDPGSHIARECLLPQDVANIRPWVDLFRRLHLPFYEEARQYFPQAIQDGYFYGANQVAMFLPETLRDIILRYEDTEEGCR